MLCIWLFAQRHFQLYYVDSGFFSAFGAVEREVQQDRICIYLCSRFSIANRTGYPLSTALFVAHRTTLSNGSSASIRPAFAVHSYSTVGTQ